MLKFLRSYNADEHLRKKQKREKNQNCRTYFSFTEAKLRQNIALCITMMMEKNIHVIYFLNKRGTSKPIQKFERIEENIAQYWVPQLILPDECNKISKILKFLIFCRLFFHFITYKFFLFLLLFFFPCYRRKEEKKLMEP